jgi:hypothetical protein
MATSSAAIRLPEYAWDQDSGDEPTPTPTPSLPALVALPVRRSPAPLSNGPRPLVAREPTLRRQLEDRSLRIIELLEAGLSPAAVSMILRHELGLPAYYTLPHIRAMAPGHRARLRGRQLRGRRRGPTEP